MEFLQVTKKDERLPDIFQFRYDVFCLEKKFYSKNSCNNMCESDQYDKYASHIVAVDDNEIVGYVRLIHGKYCTLPIENNISNQIKQALAKHKPHISEISRLAISKDHRRITNWYDSLYIQVGLYKKIYEISNAFKLTHLCAIMEDPLFYYLSEQMSIKFERIGPMFFDHGIVAPYICNIPEIEKDFCEQINEFEHRYLSKIKKSFFPLNISTAS